MTTELRFLLNSCFWCIVVLLGTIIQTEKQVSILEMFEHMASPE